MQSTLSTPNSSPASPSPRRLSWNQAVAVLLVTVGLGVLLNLWHPLLAPPYFNATLLLYIVGDLAWLPALVICLLLRPTGKRTRPLRFFLAGLVIFYGALPFIGAEVPIGAFGLPLECHTVSQTPERVQYDCVADRMFMIDTYTLEGPTGWPIVWLVAKKSVSS